MLVLKKYVPYGKTEEEQQAYWLWRKLKAQQWFKAANKAKAEAKRQAKLAAQPTNN